MGNPEPSLTAPASTATSTSTTFSDKLAVPDEPTSSSSTTRDTSASTIKREEKERPWHGHGQALESRRELDGGQQTADQDVMVFVTYRLDCVIKHRQHH